MQVQAQAQAQVQVGPAGSSSKRMLTNGLQRQ